VTVSSGDFPTVAVGTEVEKNVRRERNTETTPPAGDEEE
jgi:hypothetical protein